MATAVEPVVAVVVRAMEKLDAQWKQTQLRTDKLNRQRVEVDAAMEKLGAQWKETRLLIDTLKRQDAEIDAAMDYIRRTLVVNDIRLKTLGHQAVACDKKPFVGNLDLCMIDDDEETLAVTCHDMAVTCRDIWQRNTNFAYKRGLLKWDEGYVDQGGTWLKFRVGVTGNECDLR